MELNETEFGKVTEKLETYASQLGALQVQLTMQQQQMEHERLMEEKDRHIAELERQNREKDEHIACLEQQQEIMSQQMADITQQRDRLSLSLQELMSSMKSAAVENAFLKNCLLLSVSSVKEFMGMVRRLDVKSLMYTFLSKTLSKDMGPRGQQVIDELVPMNEPPEMEKLADQIIIDNSGSITHQ